MRRPSLTQFGDIEFSEWPMDRLATGSIHVALVTLARAQSLHVLGDLFRGFTGRHLDDFMQRGVHVSGHARGIATYVERPAALQPVEHVPGVYDWLERGGA